MYGIFVPTRFCLCFICIVTLSWFEWFIGRDPVRNDMQFFEVNVLSVVLMLSIFFDVLRFPLLQKDKGSRFFREIAVVYSLFLVISLFTDIGRRGLLSYPPLFERLLWIVHFLSFPFLLAMWAHFNAVNVFDDDKLVTKLSLLHSIPLVILTVLAFLDISRQSFYPFNARYETLLPGPGTNFMIGLSIFYCFAMILPTLAHFKDLQGSFLFISFLLPVTFFSSIVAFRVTRTHEQFMLVNAFMLVLYYLIGQRGSVQVDSLTGLPFAALLQRKLIRIIKSQSPYAFILLDIENFRYFNTRYGHELGDKMLVALAGFLSTLGTANEVFRLDSDRFCLSVPAKEMQAIDHLVARISERMGKPWELDDNSVFLQINLGIIHVPLQVASREEFKQATDQLFMEMKAGRKKSILVYTRKDSIVQQRRLNIITTLRDSVRHPEQVQVYYQPIYDVKTGRLVAAEALMRIEDKHLGLLQPGDFIALAEQTGLIMHLSHILLAKVCQMVKRIPEDSLEYIAVNLSGKDFDSKTIGNTLLGIIEREEISPRRISFEITESVVLESYEAVAEVMETFSTQDISFSLDDFGSGYSNVQALMDLPYKFVKFDASLIQRSTTNPKMLFLLADMLHKMNKIIVAEGVETEEELAMVRIIGIDRVQGFLFAGPMKGNDFLALIQASERV